jgi:hypothetical protein
VLVTSAPRALVLPRQIFLRMKKRVIGHHSARFEARLIKELADPCGSSAVMFLDMGHIGIDSFYKRSADFKDRAVP